MQSILMKKNTEKKRQQYKKSEQLQLNIAEMFNKTSVLGPGQRFVIWVRGCNKSCPGCISESWRNAGIKNYIDVRSVFEQILLIEDEIEGITISGGEPFLQAAPLSMLCEWIKKYTKLGIICYTGNYYGQLAENGNEHQKKLLAAIDLLIDGPYVDELNDNAGIRGSSNQNLIFLSDRYKQFEKELCVKKRNVELYFRNGFNLMIGVPPKKLLDLRRKEK